MINTTNIIDRAYNICSDNFIGDEIEFLVNVFVENGYDETILCNIIKQRRRKGNNDSDLEGTSQVTLSNIVTLPWVPGLSQKLRKVFKKAGYKAVFKSGANLRTILCRKK